VRLIALSLLAGVWLFSAATVQAKVTGDPLDVPAVTTRLTTSTQLSGIAQAGNRLVAVGIRGLIITSDDGGVSWEQRLSPVSSDLLAVSFPTADKGWVVGHHGVILHSSDGGVSWMKQMDGRDAATQLVAHFEKLAATGDERAGILLDEMRLNFENGPEQALLDVWFDDESTGYVVGSFGTLLSTADGGRTWRSEIEHVDYETLLHLNVVRRVGDALFVASERGVVFRRKAGGTKFEALETGYAGSFFTLIGQAHTVVAAGLRGTIFKSEDGGDNWTKIETDVLATLTGSAVAGDVFFLVSQNGRVLISTDQGSTFRSQAAKRSMTLTGVVQVNPQDLVLIGTTGVQKLTLE
jgi:photosystem II stability/assembly factor-like uncharacterized protein